MPNTPHDLLFVAGVPKRNGGKDSTEAKQSN